MFRTFVVALDLGDDGDRALPVVEALASRGPVAVELVTVSSPGMPAEADSWELERRAARFSNCRATWNVIVDSDIARGLLQHVAGRPDSVLVMTTSARRPLTAALFGGVVHDVLRNTDGPVLLVGPQVVMRVALGTTLIACVDASDAATWAVPAIVSWQRALSGMPPRVVEVVPDDGGHATTSQQHVNAMTSLLAIDRVEAVATVVHHDDPVIGLEQVADRVPGAIYVTASGRYTDGRPHLHSTTRDLVRRATRPVLIVPARPTAASTGTVGTDDCRVHRPFRNMVVLPPYRLATPQVAPSAQSPLRQPSMM